MAADDSTSRPLPVGVVRLRDQQQALTRRAILAAARELFAAHGYPGTSVRLLAQHAGVSPQTIYTVYGSKAGVVAGFPDLIDHEAGVIDLFDRHYDLADPVDLLGLIARMVRQVRQRCPDVVAVLRSGAAVDPAIAAARAEGLRRHRSGIEAIVAKIDNGDGLRGQLSVPRAADIAAALTADEICDRLVDESGWSYDEYESWLHATLTATLLV